jgi:hypothetical protein
MLLQVVGGEFFGVLLSLLERFLSKAEKILLRGEFF